MTEAEIIARYSTPGLHRSELSLTDGVQKRELRMLHFNSRERIAVHEAAHAVAVKAYGFAIDFAEICTDASGEMLGQVVWKSSGATHWAKTVVSLAGAQGKLAFYNDESGSEGDFERAEQNAREVDSENSDEIMRLAQAAAMKIVRDNRTLISALAFVLEYKDRLVGAEIDRLVNRINEIKPGPAGPDMTPIGRDAARRARRRDYEGAAFIEKWIRQRKIERRDWDQYWRNLENEKIAAPEDREGFDRDFTNTARASATPRPGIRCTFDWHLDEAELLDARGELRKAVRKRINQLLEALGEDRINPE